MGKFARSGAFVVAAAAVSSIAFAPSAFAAGGDPASLNGGSESGAYTFRIAGADRVQTAVEASQVLERDLGSIDTVIVTSSTLFPDALSVTPLADQLDAPVLTTAPGALDARVKAEITRLGASKVIILGGNVAVSPSVERSLRAMPSVSVERLGGVDRYDTSRILAAETVAYQNQNGTADQAAASTTYFNAKAALAALVARENRYQDAVSAYDAARKAAAAADAALRAAQDKVADLTAQRAALAQTLQTTGGTYTPADLTAALNSYTAANDALQAKVASQSFLTDTLGAYPGQGTTTLDIKSTLGEYRAMLTARGDYANIQKLNKAEADFGVTDATTLEDAIAAARASVTNAATAVNTASDQLAKIVLDIMNQAAANAANQPILAKMAELQKQIDALNAQIGQPGDTLPKTTLYALYNDAMQKLEAAQTELADATTARPAPGQMIAAQRALEAARVRVIQLGGNHSVFLASGDMFPDALSAGPAAAKMNGVILLSKGTVLEGYTSSYLNQSKAQVVAVGGAASTAIKTNATFKAQVVGAYVGETRYETAALVASKYFAQKAAPDAPVAIASGEMFPDAVVAGSFIANHDGALLLTRQASLPKATADYLSYTATWMTDVAIFGGYVGVAKAVDQQVIDALRL